MRFSLKVKLLGSFCIVLALMVLIAVLSYRMGNQTYADVEELGKRQVHKVELCAAIQENLEIVKGATHLQVFANEPKTKEDAIVEADKAMEKIAEALNTLKPLVISEEDKKRITDFSAAFEQLASINSTVDKKVAEGKFNEALVFYNSNFVKVFEDGMADIDGLTESINKKVDSLVTESDQEFKTTEKYTIALTVIAILVGLIIAFWLSISIVRVVNQMVNMLKDMAESGGDLTKRIQVTSKDEIGELAMWFNAFIDKLHDIISQIKQSANAVTASANETALGNQDLSQRTEEQASSLEEISSTIEEVTASLQKSTESSDEADVSSRSTLDTVHKGENVVNELHGAMIEITKGSHAIAEIIAKVNDIAFQTNLLALNAAVEAARAGEQGRGFAVVAAEVRNLAGRTAESAKEIEGLIKESIQKVEHGNELMEQTATVLGDIVDNTQKTTDVIAEIASSMREQSTAAGDIRTAVEQLNQVTQQNASLVEEIASTSESVSNEAEEMAALVGKFKLNDGTDLPGGARTAKVTKMPHTGYSAAKLVAAASEPKNHKLTEKASASFNEDDFEKF